ncbi:MAG: hypothetical protein GEU75_16355 [Dehalococcoidia bacterium]|nr:hypothetical protein [Dehalococcoidia bacterium]
MKVYNGRRVFTRDNTTRGEASVFVQNVLSHEPDGRGLTNEPNLGEPGALMHIPFHSPDGFEWGYAGSGPADLALAILADYFEEPPEQVLGALRSLWAPRSKAVALHQEFKEQFIARERRNEWRLGSDVIEAWLQTPSIQTQLIELDRQDEELAEIRRLDEEAGSADAESAD